MSTTTKETEASAAPAAKPAAVPFEFDLDARAVAVACAFAATNDIRYYLAGIYVQPTDKGAAIVATDGAQMIVIVDETGKASRPGIFRFSAPIIAKCKTIKTRRVQTLAGRVAVVGDDGEELAIQAGKVEIEGRYPEVHKVLSSSPKRERARLPAISGKNLERIGTAARLLAKLYGSTHSAVGHFANPNDEGRGVASAITAGRPAPLAVIVTMPIRDDECLDPSLILRAEQALKTEEAASQEGGQA